VWSSHNLEHVFAHEVELVLRAFLRVLRPGGQVMIATPDLQSIGEAIGAGRLEDTLYESPAGPISALDMLYGHGASIARGNEFMAHRTGFTAKTLRGKLRAAGFEAIEVNRDKMELRATGRKPRGRRRKLALGRAW
jgi:2-polyprenyl-3-methyl-5-hydroxy-6-metoxy-1,4-benzoquinol methylase